MRRPAARVAEEVRNGVVSVEAARKLYGVIVDEKTLALDAEATEKLRLS
jgi:N-methylhydantoinase B